MQSTSVTSVVLDASALMAFLHSEPGGDIVWQALSDAVISAVNYSEVLKKPLSAEKTPTALHRHPPSVSSILPFDEAHAAAAAELYPDAKPHGMSFADRALSFTRRDAPRITVLTAESKMRLVTLPIKVKLIRNAH